MFPHSISFKLSHAPFHDVTSHFVSAFDSRAIKGFRQLISSNDKSRNSDPVTTSARTTSCEERPQETYRLPRKISAPCLITSTHNLRESWYRSFASAHDIGHIASEFVSDINAVIPLHAAGNTQPVDKHAAAVESPSAFRDVSNERAEVAPEDDEKSVYSQESADPNLHGYLLSMPIIPRIKLERKATIKEPENPPEKPHLRTDRDSFLSPTGFRPQLVRSSSDRNLHRRRGMAGMRNFANTLGGGKGQRWSSVEVLRFDQTVLSQSGRHQRKSTGSSGALKPHSAPTYRSSVSLPALAVPTMSVDGEVSPFQENGAMLSRAPRDDANQPPADRVGSSRSSLLAFPSSSKVTSRLKAPLPSKRGHRRSFPRASNKEQRPHNHEIASRLQVFTPRFLKSKSSSSSSVRRDPDDKWAPKDGMIIVKVFVPSTSDTWKLKVPEDINLQRFTCKVLSKLGFHVAFSGSCWDSPEYFFTTNASFRHWLKGRIRFGRNLPIVAHVVDPPVRHSMG